MTTLSKGLFLLIASIITFTFGAFSQGSPSDYKVVLIGQVVNSENGAPINEQKISICADSVYTMNFTYSKIVYTDVKGFFYDTINTNCIKGGLSIYTLDYLDTRHDTSVYFRFQWSDVNTLFANFSLPISSPPTGYQANFISYSVNDNPFEIAFIDKTNSADVVAWEWSFGDGIFSNEANPQHLYEEPGIYRVSLNVEIIDATDSIPILSSIEKIISIVHKSYYHLGGHVFTGNFPIDTGIVYLYKMNDKDIEPIDTALFNEALGYYLFYQLIDGEYFVKADIPSSSNAYMQFFPTYFSNEIFWTEADTIFHGNTNFEYDIHMVPLYQSTNGPGLISGSITFNSSGSKASAPACDAEILLLDEDDEPITIAYSDENGEFNFEDLELTNYKVFPEVTGKYTVAIDIALDETNPVVNDLEIVISSTMVNGNVNGLTELEWETGFGEVYPNPADEMAYIQIEQSETADIQIEVYNNLGQILKQSRERAFAGESTLSLNVSSLDNGIYFLRISEGNRNVIRKFVKK